MGIWILFGLLCLVLFNKYLGVFETPTEEDLCEAPFGVWICMNILLSVGAIILWPMTIYIVYKIRSLE